MKEARVKNKFFPDIKTVQKFCTVFALGGAEDSITKPEYDCALILTAQSDQALG